MKQAKITREAKMSKLGASEEEAVNPLGACYEESKKGYEEGIRLGRELMNKGYCFRTGFWDGLKKIIVEKQTVEEKIKL